jgi:2-succinyl-6-hydroxy-2,4-cyclohexadiene-1-carboxylate synthase
MTVKIYCLPGTMCDQRLWQACAEHLPENIELIHIAIPVKKNIDEIVTALKQQFPAGKINLVGFSLGGYLASAYALKYPEKINKLLLISNMSYSLPEAELKQRSRTIAYLKTHGYLGIPTKRITALLDVSKQKNYDIINCVREMDTDLGKETLIYQLTVTTQRENLLIKLPKLHFPVQFLIGDNDLLVNINLIEAIATQSPLISLSVLNNTGHMLPLEQPEKCALNIKRFFIE